MQHLIRKVQKHSVLQDKYQTEEVHLNCNQTAHAVFYNLKPYVTDYFIFTELSDFLIQTIKRVYENSMFIDFKVHFPPPVASLLALVSSKSAGFCRV